MTTLASFIDTRAPHDRRPRFQGGGESISNRRLGIEPEDVRDLHDGIGKYDALIVQIPKLIITIKFVIVSKARSQLLVEAVSLGRCLDDHRIELDGHPPDASNKELRPRVADDGLGGVTRT
jgi:hypothetical protein